MKKLLSQFVREEDGAAMIEYTVLIGLITAATIALIIAVGLWVNGQDDPRHRAEHRLLITI